MTTPTEDARARIATKRVREVLVEAQKRLDWDGGSGITIRFRAAELSALRALIEPPCDDQEWDDSQETEFVCGNCNAGITFPRQVSHPEPEQWEYGCRQENGYVASAGAAWMTLEYAQAVSANDSAVMGVRRRKPGPWLPVPEEEL